MDPYDISEQALSGPRDASTLLSPAGQVAQDMLDRQASLASGVPDLCATCDGRGCPDCPGEPPASDYPVDPLARRANDAWLDYKRCINAVRTHDETVMAIKNGGPGDLMASEAAARAARHRGDRAATRYHEARDACHAPIKSRPPEPLDPTQSVDGTEPPPEPMPDWRTDPKDYLLRHKGTYALVRAAITQALASVNFEDKQSEESIRSMIALMAVPMGQANAWRLKQSGDFIPWGPLAVPTSPEGLRALQVIKELAAKTSLAHIDDVAGMGEATPLRTLTEAFANYRWGLVGTPSNVTQKDGHCFAFSLHEDPYAFSNLPSGKVAPRSLLADSLIGAHVDDPLQLTQDSDMCAQGVAEFCDEFDIGYERSAGDCEHCGSESCEDDEIMNIDSFDVTQAMVDSLGDYLDNFREHIGADDESDSWLGLLENQTDEEILERCAPSEEGIKYNPKAWRFTPDFEAIEGLEDLGWSETARILPLLARIAAAYAAVDMLPPIGGSLELIPAYNGDRVEGSAFMWEPEEGELSHRISADVALRIVVKSGAKRLTLKAPSQFVIVGDGGQFTMGGASVGSDPAMMLAIHQGSADL